jgi:hypothetical protein
VSTHIDNTPRYAPKTVMVRKGGRYVEAPITGYIAHPPNAHPKHCPLVPTCTAVEFITPYGSRWWGCEKAWINSELRMVMSGFDLRNELINKWEIVPEGLR